MITRSDQLYLEVKAGTKHYTAIVQAIRAKSECEFNFDLPAAFEMTVLAI